MSNAMRLGKRSLAGVAAGALALGMLSIAGAGSVSAKPSAKPKATFGVTATAAPIRVTYTGTTLDSVPYSTLSFTAANSATLSNAATAVVALTSAPSPVAQLGIVSRASAGTFATYGTTGTPAGVAQFLNAEDTLSLTHAQNVTTIDVGDGTAVGVLGLAANEAGTYTGTITVGPDSNLDQQIAAFSFTTSGRAATLTLSPATQTVPVSGRTALTATLRDTAGNITQPLAVDTITTSPQTAASATNGQAQAIVVGGASPASGNFAANSIYAGTATITYDAASTPGLYSVSAVPGGTLPSGGVTTQQASITVSGQINPAPVTAISVTEPADAYAVTTTVTGAAWQVPAGTTSVTVQVAGTAGTTYRFAAQTGGTPGGGTVNGSSTATTPVYATVTPGANGRGTMTFTLGGNATISGSNVVITQVNAAGGTVSSGGVITVTQANPAVAADSIYVTPYGSVVAALGSTVNVSVLVTDQFGDPVANSVVRAFRSSTSGALLSTATTNASGVAALTVSGATGIAAGTTESYVFQATTNNVAVTALGAIYSTLSVQYTAAGTVTGMTVAVTGGAQTPILNTTPAITSMPFMEVPYGGTVTTSSTGVYTVATGAGTAAGNYAIFTPSSTPANTVTVTVPEGVKVTTYNPTQYTVAWNSALAGQTVNVASTQPVYIFATKTGTHDITFTSGGITATAKVRVATVPAAAYNIAVSPTSRTIEAGAFSTVELTVSDVFGNPIPGIAATVGSAGAVAASATGEVLLSGLSATTTLGTGTAGTASVTLIAGKTGVGKVTFAPSSGTSNAAAAWQAGYIKPTGAPDPVKSAEVNIVVQAAAEKSIVIAGERTTVSGKPGIRVDGEADGFENGAKVKPWVRFPGETAYTAGSARPVVTDEAFTWQRKTGKKTYVYFTSEDESVRSNRVIIAAN